MKLRIQKCSNRQLMNSRNKMRTPTGIRLLGACAALLLSGQSALVAQVATNLAPAYQVVDLGTLALLY